MIGVQLLNGYWAETALDELRRREFNVCFIEGTYRDKSRTGID